VTFTIRARLTLLYLAVLAAAFVAFFWICDLGFRRSIDVTVDNASQSNLKTIQRLLEHADPKGLDKTRHELSELAALWANDAIFQVAGPDGEWLYRADRFRSPQIVFPPATGKISFLTTNLDWLQYRIARQRVLINGNAYEIYAAVPTEPFDQALDRFRVIEKEFLPLLALVPGLLGYWLSGRALAPVNKIIHSAERIDLRNLRERVEVPKAHDELRRLSETVNAMLARIEASVARITQFTADASHDLRTPLSLVRTHAELALRRPRSEAEYRASLSKILIATDQTTQLVDQLLTLARADAGAAQLHFQEQDLSAILRAAASTAQEMCDAKGLRFTANIPDAAVPVRGDAPALERLFLCIIENAVKYTPAGEVFLYSEVQNGSVSVAIRDTGLGIAEKDLPHVFDRFFRADQARSVEVRGSGLGMAIARWIAEAHQGTITAASEFGKGSTFEVRLPLYSGEVADSSNRWPLKQKPVNAPENAFT
jgi:heavy metal sensor kinase